MQGYRKLILGLGLAILGLFIVMLYIGSDQHHEKMVDRKAGIQIPAGMLNVDGPGAQQFQKTCTTCHGVPDPGEYTANEWPLIIERMHQHMVKAGKTIPEADTVAAITEYLQRNARVVAASP